MQVDFELICNDMCFVDGIFWLMLIIFDVDEEIVNGLFQGDQFVFCDFEGVMFVVLNVEDVWKYDCDFEVDKVYGSCDKIYFVVVYFYDCVNDYVVGGIFEGFCLLLQYDYLCLCLMFVQLCCQMFKFGWNNVVVFQMCNLMYCVYYELMLCVFKEFEVNLFVYLVVGMIKFGDVDYYI